MNLLRTVLLLAIVLGACGAGSSRPPDATPAVPAVLLRDADAGHTVSVRIGSLVEVDEPDARSTNASVLVPAAGQRAGTTTFRAVAAGTASVVWYRDDACRDPSCVHLPGAILESTIQVVVSG